MGCDWVSGECTLYGYSLSYNTVFNGTRFEREKLPCEDTYAYNEGEENTPYSQIKSAWTTFMRLKTILNLCLSTLTQSLVAQSFQVNMKLKDIRVFAKWSLVFMWRTIPFKKQRTRIIFRFLVLPFNFPRRCLRLFKNSLLASERRRWFHPKKRQEMKMLWSTRNPDWLFSLNFVEDILFPFVILTNKQIYYY